MRSASRLFVRSASSLASMPRPVIATPAPALLRWNSGWTKSKNPFAAAERITGTVKWFNTVKGFGFVTRNDDQTDLFVHVKEIKTEGFKELTGGQTITFIVKPKKRGPAACEVEIQK